MEESKVEWHEFKGGRHVAICGDEILGIIDPMQDFPCKAFGLQTLNGVYTSVEAAKVDGEKAIARFLKAVDSHDKPAENIYLDVLKAAVAVLDAKEKAAK